MSESSLQRNEESLNNPMARESSLGGVDDLAEAHAGGYEAEEEEDEALDLPPGRMHATRSAAELRLKGSRANITVSMPTLPSSSNDSVGSGSSGSGMAMLPGRRRSASGNLGGSGDYSPRSKSPLLHRGTPPAGGTATTATADGNSSISSLEDIVDSDILYDRAGFSDSDVLSASSAEKVQQRKQSREFINLPSVNERLSEDTLEDVHAFSDVKQQGGSSSASRANSITTADQDKAAFLDPLVEAADEDEVSLEDPSESSEMPPVILTNIENLSLQAPAAQQHPYPSTISEAGRSSQAQVVVVPEGEEDE